MPKVALAKLITDWKQLLRAAAEHADKKGLRAHLRKLEIAIQRFEKIEAKRAELQARLQQATQELGEVKEDGKLAAVEIRSILKGIFGHSSERLSQYNMRPRRSRRSKTTPPTVPAAE